MPIYDLIDPAHEPDTSLGGIPYCIEETLEVDEPAYLYDDERPLAKRLREIIKHQGISCLDLARRMTGTRMIKALRMLDAVTHGKSNDDLLIGRIYGLLGVSAETLASIQREEEEFSALRSKEASRRKAHAYYRYFGPHLTALIDSEHEKILRKYVAPYRGLSAKVAYTIKGNRIIAPGPEKVAAAIRSDKPWLPRVAKRHVLAYIYQRMPEEAHVIDPGGSIIASGDWQYALPFRVQELFYGGQQPS